MEENEKMNSKQKMLSLKKGDVSASDFKKARSRKEKTVTESRKRKRICVDMLDAISDTYPKGKKALIEEIGVEPD